MYGGVSRERRWPGQSNPRRVALGTNCAALQWAHDEHADRVIVCSAIDNLGKGAAGQALQNANLVLGLDETSGLTANGVAP